MAAGGLASAIAGDQMFPEMRRQEDRHVRRKAGPRTARAERAYYLWLGEGRPEGQAEQHWRRAREIEEDVAASHGAAAAAALERLIDEEGEESFPASDPPSHTPVVGERRTTFR